MFSLIGDACCERLPEGPCCGGGAKPLRVLDIAGIITLIVLGALAASGMGGDVVNSLNTVSNLPIGGWIMIGGGVLASMLIALISPNNMREEISRNNMR